MTDTDQNDLLLQFADLVESRLTPDDVALLNARLARDAEARLLYMQWMDMQMELENVTKESAPPMPVRPSSRRFWPVFVLVAAVAIAFLFVNRKPTDLKTVPEAVTAEVDVVSEASGLQVVATMDAVWGGESRPSIENSTLSSGRLQRLEQGVIEVRGEGVRYVIEGPALFECGDRMLRLARGRVLVSVEDDAGVVVHTPSAELVDLGTVFGVEISNASEACHVFEGAVRATAKWSASDGKQVPAQDIFAGQSISLRPQVSGRFSEIDDADWLGFVWRLHNADGVTALGGKVDVRAEVPKGYSRDYPIVLVPEGDRLLAADLLVDVHAPGKYQGPFDEPTSAVAAGTSVRSFVAHYAPGRHQPPREIRVAVITFDTPVLGIICSPKGLASSDRLFANVAPQLTHRKLAKTGHLALEGEDGIYLSEDRRQVAIYMEAWFADQIRILTEDPR